MRVRVIVVLIALLGVTLGLSSCSPPAAPLPTAPAATALPAPTTTVVVPASWSVPVAPGASCPTAGPPATTFGQAQWDSFLANLAVQANLANPTHATLTGLRIEFPVGCYYVDSPVYLDANHPLVDTVIDGGYTGNPANSPQFVQTTVPDCATGPSMLTVQNAASWRLQLTGLTVQGSAPATPPYCGSDPGGIAVAGPAGSTGPHDVSIVGNSIHNTWGDNLYVGIVDHLLADGNTLRVAGRQSMSVVAGHDITVTHNTLEYADGPAFTIETNEGSDNVSRVLIDSNAASYANAAGTDAGKLNGALWNATAAVGTTVSDVMFKNNTSKSALIMWERVGMSSSGAGAMHRVAFVSNTTTSNAGMVFLFAGDNITVTGNKVLSGPAVALGNWTDNPVTMYAAIPTKSPTVVCGTASGNTYVNSTGSTLPWRVASHNGTLTAFGYSMPAC